MPTFAVAIDENWPALVVAAFLREILRCTIQGAAQVPARVVREAQEVEGLTALRASSPRVEALPLVYYERSRSPSHGLINAKELAGSRRRRWHYDSVC